VYIKNSNLRSQLKVQHQLRKTATIYKAHITADQQLKLEAY